MTLSRPLIFFAVIGASAMLAAILGLYKNPLFEVYLTSWLIC